jgi:hypothetical protein
MKKYYSINYSLLAVWLTPTMLRNDVETAFLTSLAKPLDSLNGEFNAYVQSLKTQIKAQTCYMQAMLNDEFDFNERRIRVRTAPINFDYYLLWKENQNKPIMVSGEETDEFKPYLLSRDGLISTNNVDFEIVLPRGYTLSISELRNLRTLVNQNKMASKKYRIVYE